MIQGVPLITSHLAVSLAIVVNDDHIIGSSQGTEQWGRSSGDAKSHPL